MRRSSRRRSSTGAGASDGPIEIRYFAFARITAENECVSTFASPRRVRWRSGDLFNRSWHSSSPCGCTPARDSRFPAPHRPQDSWRSSGARRGGRRPGAQGSRQGGHSHPGAPRTWDLPVGECWRCSIRSVSDWSRRARHERHSTASRLAAPTGMELAVRLPFLAERWHRRRGRDIGPDHRRACRACGKTRGDCSACRSTITWICGTSPG